MELKRNVLITWKFYKPSVYMHYINGNGHRPIAHHMWVHSGKILIPKNWSGRMVPILPVSKKVVLYYIFFTLIYIYFMYLPMYFWCIFWNWNNKLKWTELNWMIIISIIKECAQVIGPLLIMCYTHFNQASCKWVDCNQGNIPRHNPLFASLFDQSLQRFKISC